MINLHEDIFELHTDHTSYIFRNLPSGQLEHLYYGSLIHLTCPAAIAPKRPNQIGNAVMYEDPAATRENQDGKKSKNKKEKESEPFCLSLENLCQETSGLGKGGLSDPFVEIAFADGSCTTDFKFKSARVLEGAHAIQGLPTAYETESAHVQTLEVVLKEAHTEITLELFYTVFEETDVIARSSRITNNSGRKINLRRLMSLQLDLDASPVKVTSFHGAWAREMEKEETIVSTGRFVNESLCGFSGNRNNNFFIVGGCNAGETSGECIGFHLLYSGNHYGSVSVNAYDQTRILTGISPTSFCWTLEDGEYFESPQAVMCYSGKGYRLLSHRLHRFVREHIVRGKWKHRERPVLVNSWEASYFAFNEKSLLKLAKASAQVGAELFVLDDGWFGKRNDDTSSLGDWYTNLKKLPSGLEGLSDQIHTMGLMFGIWVEPEMISENSDLYKAHPDWAVRIPNRDHSIGRNQMLLDLTRLSVREYVLDSMRRVFSVPGIDYVKWDMNRVFSDAYSQKLLPEQQGGFAHRYILGLYEILDTLTKEFPDILFESCASGGNRADLGMLCYMPQLWASDNTDAIDRSSIQEGYSFGYPMSVLGCHVSGCPNHQTLRSVPLETRFHVAMAGLLGYELNLCELTAKEQKEIAMQIALYKSLRKHIMTGTYYRLGEASLRDDSKMKERNVRYAIVSADQRHGYVSCLNLGACANRSYDRLRVPGLNKEGKYWFVSANGVQEYVDVTQFGSLINAVSPVHIKQNSFLHRIVASAAKMKRENESYVLTGSELSECGLCLHPVYGGTGFNEYTRVYPDFASRLYLLEQKEI